MDQRLLTVVKALADPDRIRVAAALLERPRAAGELASAMNLSRSDVQRHLDRLRAAGLAMPDAAEGEPRWSIERAAFIDIGRWIGELEGRQSTADADRAASPAGPAEDARVLRAFVVDGRLASIPAQEKKRAVILRWLLDKAFTEDRAYPEKEVNQRLALVHRDVASLRRYLVDAGLMTRSGGVYRRTTRP